MAIAFDAVTDFDGSLGTSVSTTHTGTGSNLFVFVAVRLGGASANLETLSSVTYGGNTMTQVQGYVFVSVTENLSLWYLKAPPSGSQTVTATWSNPLIGNLKIDTYTGVDQSNPLDSSVQVNGTTSTSITLTITTGTDNSWLGGTVRSGSALSAGANTTIRTGSVYISCDTNSDQTPPGSHSMNLTQSNDIIGGLALGFKPAATAGAISRSATLNLLGVGS